MRTFSYIEITLGFAAKTFCFTPQSFIPSMQTFSCIEKTFGSTAQSFVLAPQMFWLLKQLSALDASQRDDDSVLMAIAPLTSG